MTRLFRIVAIVIAALAGAYLVLALALVYWPADTFPHGPPPPALTQESYPHAEQRFLMRDGKHLFARVFGTELETTIVLVHGFGVDSSAYERIAGPWHEATAARIILLDLRGHGHSEGAQGRVHYVGQYADDLSDVIEALRKQAPGRIVLAGHSMGGGVVLAYAGTAGLAPVDAYLLIAPALGSNAPTAPATGGPRPCQPISTCARRASSAF